MIPAQRLFEGFAALTDVNIYDGAGHGFPGNQGGREGANRAASEGAWPTTVSFFRELLED